MPEEFFFWKGLRLGFFFSLARSLARAALSLEPVVSPSFFLSLHPLLTSDAKVQRELGEVVPDPGDGDAGEAGADVLFRVGVLKFFS